MTLNEFAERILHADTLAGKLWQPAPGVDALHDVPGDEPVAWSEPSRPTELQIAPKGSRKRLPHPDALHEARHRIRCLHTFANHELMALELMAWALLAYPEAPTPFRRGLVHILADEQRHLRMYADRIEGLGARFGDLPVNDHFWRCAESLTTPLKWVCAMNLVFEQANLDFAPEYQSHFRRVGDDASADIMVTIEEDEIHHVGFGAHWLKEYTPSGRSTFEVWQKNLTFYNTPDRARGDDFNADARRRAGLDDDFVEKMRQAR